MKSVSSKKLREYLLEVLSFYEAMSLERILLELDPEGMKDNPDWEMSDLKGELKKLMISGHIIEEISPLKEKQYRRSFPPKTYLGKLSLWLRSIEWPWAK